MNNPKKLKPTTLSKIEKFYIEGTMTEDEFIKRIKSEYIQKDAEMIIADAQKRKNDKDRPQEEVEEIKTSFVRTATVEQTILEAIKWKNRAMFLGLNVGADPDKRWIIAPLANTPTVRYMPIEDTPYPPYTVSEADLVWMKEGLKEIPPLSHYYPKVHNEVQQFISAPKETQSLISNTILLSYDQHKFNSLGYPSFLGIHDTGKTRVGEIIAGMGYRPLMSMKLNAANVYDFIGTENEGDCTIIDDEIQDLANDPEKAKIYRSGYRKNAKVRRILEPSSTKRTYRYYNTYCLKILLGYYLPNDQPLISRCIPRIMTSGYPEKDEIDDEDRLRFSKLKNELLLSRMVHYFDPPPNQTINLKGRLKEVWKAQLLCSFNTPAKEDIVKLVGEYVTELEAERKSSLDAHLVTVVSALYETRDQSSMSFEEIWWALLFYIDEGEHLENGKTSIQSSKLDMKISKWIIGKKLKTVLVGRKSDEWVDNKSTVVYKFDKKTLDSLQQRFKITGEDKFNCIHLRFGDGSLVEKAYEIWRISR